MHEYYEIICKNVHFCLSFDFIQEKGYQKLTAAAMPPGHMEKDATRIELPLTPSRQL